MKTMRRMQLKQVTGPTRRAAGRAVGRAVGRAAALPLLAAGLPARAHAALTGGPASPTDGLSLALALGPANGNLAIAALAVAVAGCAAWGLILKRRIAERDKTIADRHRELEGCRERAQALGAENARLEKQARTRSEPGNGGMHLIELAGAASDWIWATDEQLRFSFVSDDFEPSTGTPPRTILGKTRWEYAGGDPDQDENWARHRACMEAREPIRDFRYRHVCEDGRELYYRISGVPYFDESGKFLGYRGTANSETGEFLTRKRAKELEQSYREIYENAVVGIFRSTSQGLVLQANPAMVKLFGFTDETELLNAVNSAPDDDDEQPVLRGLLKREIEKNRVLKGYETELWDRDRRKPIWVSISAREVRDQAGEVTYFVGMIENISKRKKAEASLLRRERELAQAQRIGRSGHWRWFIDEDMVERSVEMCALLGLPQHMIRSGKADGDSFIHPDDRESFRALQRACVETRQPFTSRHRVVLPNGAIRHFACEGHPEIDSHGRVVSVFGINRDITEQRLADAALKESEARNRAIVEALDRAHVGLAISSEKRGITDVNASLLNFVELKDKSLIVGKKLTDLQQHGATDFTAFRRNVYEALETSSAVSGELAWRRADGERVYLSVQSGPFIDDEIIHVVYDITEKKQHERREAELEEGLKQRQKMEALGQLAGGIAHEINNLLHPIINFTTLTRRRIDDPQLDHYLSRSLDCGRKAAEIVNDVLTFARKGTGETKPVDLAELTPRTARFAQDLTPRDIELITSVAEVRAVAEVNETDFIQVILNLVQNATDAMEGRGRIRLEMDTPALAPADAEKLSLNPGRYARITVSDRGHGIAGDVIGHVFEPFFTTKEVGRGTGLGLAVVYGIVKGWNGAISINSEKGEGAVVEVYIPIECDRS